MAHTDTFHAYLQAYARKDLAQVARLFADDIDLCDWNLAVSGKAAALAETARNFAAAKTLVIDTLAVYTHGHGVAGELRIVVDGQVELRVVDVLNFNAEGQISSIRAYLGRSDAG